MQAVQPGAVYAVDVEVWPTNVLAETGGRLVLEVASGDTQGSGMFQHNSEVDRLVGPASSFLGERRKKTSLGIVLTVF